MTTPVPVRGEFATANLVPRGRRYIGKVAGTPYPVPHYKARRLVKTRLDSGRKLKSDEVPKGPWVTMHFFDLGYHEVPVAWLRPSAPPKPKPDTPKKRKKRK